MSTYLTPSNILGHADYGTNVGNELFDRGNAINDVEKYTCNRIQHSRFGSNG